MTATAGARPSLLRRALRLEYLTIGWNIVEGVVAIAAAVAAGGDRRNSLPDLSPCSP